MMCAAKGIVCIVKQKIGFVLIHVGIVSVIAQAWSRCRCLTLGAATNECLLTDL